MRRVLVLVVLLCAACAGGADATSSDLCESGDLACGVLDEADLAELFGEDVEVVSQAVAQLGESVDWCDTIVPSPVERFDQGFAVTSDVDGVTVAVSSTILRFDGADAELTMEVLGALRQGCSWTEGTAEFRFLDDLDVAGFGDEAAGLLVRSVVGATEDNAEVIVIRQGDVISQVGLFPAQASPVLWDALGRRMEDRLTGAAGD